MARQGTTGEGLPERTACSSSLMLSLGAAGCYPSEACGSRRIAHFAANGMALFWRQPDGLRHMDYEVESPLVLPACALRACLPACLGVSLRARARSLMFNIHTYTLTLLTILHTHGVLVMKTTSPFRLHLHANCCSFLRCCVPHP